MDHCILVLFLFVYVLVIDRRHATLRGAAVDVVRRIIVIIMVGVIVVVIVYVVEYESASSSSVIVTFSSVRAYLLAALYLRARHTQTVPERVC